MSLNEAFELLDDRDLTEINSRALFYRHNRTGAEVLSLLNDDDNKVFIAAFRTPPGDSTGVAHILEHSVLCGSRKYPLKEPFVELLKGSLKTFLNAFTYPDKTCYPVASQNVTDFYNLIDVYLDAVFYPLIGPHIFQQEGWHLDLEDPQDTLQFKGVVYNEMKGVYSSPDSILAEASQQSLFPDTTYGMDSGGDPRHIPDLTYEQFRDFHRTYYHPSNARIGFYGNDDPARRLEILDEYLRQFDRLPPESAIRKQGRFQSPKHVRRSFAVGPSDSGSAPDAKGMITVNWLLPDVVDTELNLSLQCLQYALLGMPGSPLRKALIESGLGDGLAGSGLETELLQMYFSAGLKGIETRNAGRVESLILETLSDLAERGLEQATIEAALNTVEFRLRENNAGSFPRGLVLLLRALTTWLHGSDPMSMLAFETPLNRVKDNSKADPEYFQSIVRRLLIDNPHRTTVILEPDNGLAERESSEERARLDVLRDAMDHERLAAVVENTKELRRLQEQPDPPEALASIPSLSLSDLERKNRVIPAENLSLGQTDVLFHDIATNGIVYVDVGFDLHVLPQALVPYVPLFGRAMLEMGTDEEDFVSLSQQISSKTGGIRPETFTSSLAESESATAWMFLRGKSTLDRAGWMLRILQKIISRTRLDDRERFRQIVLEEKSRQERRIVPNGHQMINLRLRAGFRKADLASEAMSGISYLYFLRELEAKIGSDWTTVLSDLEQIRRSLLNRATMLVNVTVNSSGWEQVRPLLEEFCATLPHFEPKPQQWQLSRIPAFEGLIIPAQVNYVGKGMDLYSFGYKFHGSILAISGYLRNSYLWEKVRVQGGAYGAMCLFDRISGVLTFVSYRDPNLLATVENFDRAAEFLATVRIDEAELTKAIIGTIGSIDTHLLPDAQGYVSMIRHLSRDSDQTRQKMRDEVLSTVAGDFRNFAQTLADVAGSGIVKVLGSEGAIDSVSATNPGWLRVERVL